MRRSSASTSIACGSLLATCAAVSLIVTSDALPMAAQTARPAADACASGAPRNRVDACSQVLLRIPLDPQTKVMALVNRAAAHDALDERTMAMDDHRAALAVDPNSVPALRGRAGVLYRSGQVPAAMTDLSRAIQLAPDDAASFRLRGDIRAESGDPGAGD
ncbi:MAG: tetratricopeptide repeat protein [Vicinamibacterales bacterium]